MINNNNNNNNISLVGYSSILIYNPESKKFYYEIVSEKLAKFYSLSPEDFIGKPLYFSKNYTTSDNIDIEECHKKFEYLIKKSLKDGFSFDFIKINTFYLDINNSINVLMISLRLEYNRILNFGLNIKFLEKILLDKYNYLNNLYLKILTLIPFNIIVINDSLDILFDNRLENKKEEEKKMIFSSLLNNNTKILEDIKDTIKIIDINNVIQKDYKIGKSKKLRLYIIKLYKENNINNLYLIVLQDIDNILKLENELLNLINLLDKEKDKVNIILKGYSESDLKENNRINLIKKITSTTIKGKIKEDQMYDKQIYSLLKDIEILKKDINKLDNDCMQIIKEINQESTNKINKLDFIISSLNSDIKKIKDIYIEKKDLNLITILKNTSKEQLIIFFTIIIISSVILQKVVIDRIRNIINDPLILIEELLE